MEQPIFPGTLVNDKEKRGTEEINEFRHLHSRAEASEVLVEILGQARRQIIVFAPVLDGFLFNTSAVARALASFAAAHRRNTARFLIEHSAQVVHDNGRVVELCRRFRDLIKMRQVNNDDAGLREMFVIADGRSYLHQRDIDAPDYLAGLDVPRAMPPLMLEYERMWERGSTIPSVITVGL